MPAIGVDRAASGSTAMRWRPYAVALASVLLAWLLREALSPVIGATALPFVTFFPAVACAAWYGGTAAGAGAMLLSVAIGIARFLDPAEPFGPGPVAASLLFVVAAATILFAIDRMHRGRRDLAEARDVLSVTLTSIGDGVIVTDAEGRARFLNPEAERLTGWRSADAAGRPLDEVFRIINEQSRRTVESPVDKVLRDGVTVGLANHTLLIARDGRETPIDDSAAPVVHPGDPVLGVVLVFRDVHEQRLAERARARLAAIVENSGDAILSKTLDGTILTWNAAAEGLFGYQAGEIVGRSIKLLIPPERHAEEDAIVQQLRRGEPVELIETVRITKDGRRFIASVRVSPLRDADGEIIGASKLLRDVTELVAAREELAREKELLGTTLASIGDGVIATDRAARVTFLNPIAQQLTGWTQQDAVGELLANVFRIVDERSGQAVANPALVAMEEGRIVSLANHTVLLTRDGHERPIEDSGAPIRDLRGDVVGSVLVFRDVSARRQVEQERRNSETALRESEARLRVALEGTPVTLFRCDRDLRFTWVHNPQLPARAPAEWLGRRYDELLPEPAAGELVGLMHQVLTTEQPARRVVGVPLGDSTWYFDSVVEPIPGGEGHAVGLRGAMTDVTALRAAEQTLRDVDRRKNDFLAMLAHELRNPLSAIKNSILLLQSKGPPDPELVAARGVIERQGQQLSRLLDDLLDVSRLERHRLALRREPIQLAAVVASAVETVRPAIDQGRHRLELDVPDGILLDADALRLAQVFANLLHNAAKYMDAGGLIRLDAGVEDGQVLVSVTDHGIGIPPDALPKLFEMFAQVPLALERAQGGIGVGLALSKGIVELHGGTITAHSEGPGAGSRFTVRLPLGSRRERRARGPVDPPRPGSATRRILIADDVRDNADTLAKMLGALGHDVHVAYDGAEALQLAERVHPDVALLDLAMPRMSGYEACRRIRAQPWGRDVHLVAQTGLGRDEDVRRAEQAGFDDHLLKPIDFAALVVLLANGR